MERLVELMSTKPRERFNIITDVGFAVFDVGEEYEINPEKFVSMGKSTPFKGEKVYGKCLLTVYEGRVAHSSIG